MSTLATNTDATPNVPYPPQSDVIIAQQRDEEKLQEKAPPSQQQQQQHTLSVLPPPSAKPSRIIYCYPDSTVEEYILVRTTRASNGGDDRPMLAQNLVHMDGAAAAVGSNPLASTDAVNGASCNDLNLTTGASPPTKCQFTIAEAGNLSSNSNVASQRCPDDEMVMMTTTLPAVLQSTSNGGGVPLVIHCCCNAERSSDISPANPRIGSPGPVTLFAFGITTCMYNVHMSGICPLNMSTMGVICFYGGLAQVIGGFFELINKNTIFCTMDVTYGSFWIATAMASLMPENSLVINHPTEHFMGGFFMLWFFFAATMFMCSLKLPYVQVLLCFCVALNFLLNTIGHFAASTTTVIVAGYVGMVEGSLATYVGMAYSLKDIYGRSFLPLFYHDGFEITHLD